MSLEFQVQSKFINTFHTPIYIGQQACQPGLRQEFNLIVLDAKYRFTLFDTCLYFFIIFSVVKSILCYHSLHCRTSCGKRTLYCNIQADIIEIALIFFCTFERVALDPDDDEIHQRRTSSDGTSLVPFRPLNL